MTFEDALRAADDADQLLRPARERLVLPVLRVCWGGNLAGRRVIELGAGDTLLLSQALARAGASVVAIDPCLEAVPAPSLPGVSLLATDVLEAAPDLPAAEATVSTMLFGAPLRQRARRALWPRYLAGDRPTEADVHRVLAGVEANLIDVLARLTAPGGLTLHWSLEGLFAATDAAWVAAGFDPPTRRARFLAARRR